MHVYVRYALTSERVIIKLQDTAEHGERNTYTVQIM